MMLPTDMVSVAVSSFNTDSQWKGMRIIGQYSSNRAASPSLDNHQY